jgi:hypothetical protein
MSAGLPGRSERGFGYMRFEYKDYRGGEPRSFSVQESSLATEQKLWVGPDESHINDHGIIFEAPRAHLGIEEVRKVRDALTAWLEEVDQ